MNSKEKVLKLFIAKIGWGTLDDIKTYRNKTTHNSHSQRIWAFATGKWFCIWDDLN
jgi:hypothetical protein